MKLDIHLWREQDTCSTLSFSYEESDFAKDQGDWSDVQLYRATYIGPFLAALSEMLEPGDHLHMERVK